MGCICPQEGDAQTKSGGGLSSPPPGQLVRCQLLGEGQGTRGQEPPVSTLRRRDRALTVTWQDVAEPEPSGSRSWLVVIPCAPPEHQASAMPRPPASLPPATRCFPVPDVQ